MLKLLFSGTIGICDWRRMVSSTEMQIGRRTDPVKGLLLDHDPVTSAFHARVRLETAGVVISDLDSKNGLFVNGLRLKEALLHDGDVLRIGNSLLLLRYESLDMPDASPDTVQQMLRGEAPATRRLRHQLACAAPQKSSVLLQGPTGTGKELAAKAIHQLSGRHGRLVRVNAAAISSSLAESMLFGHVAGAFTGAHNHTGFIREADGGTLVLDEIGELPLELQPKLLRVLEEGLVLPVGGRRPETIDVRFVASTNRDLRQSVAAGTFRADLRERLATLMIDLPPLSARKEDIIPLFLHFLGTPGQRLTARLCERLLIYPWPGNIRELSNLADRARTFCIKEGELDLPSLLNELRLEPDISVYPNPLAPEVPTPTDQAKRPRYPRRHCSAEELERLLQENDGKIERVADLIKVDRQTIRRWIEKFAIDMTRFRKGR